jgi:hypothetical protein
MEDEETFLVGFKLEKGNVGLSIVELKSCTIMWYISKTKPLQSKKKKNKAMFYLGEITRKPIIMENYEGIPIVPS